MTQGRRPSRSARLLLVASSLTGVWLMGCAAPDEPVPAYPELRLAFDHLPPRVYGEVADGRAWLEPSEVSIDTVGTYALNFEVGRQAIAPGGEILVEFPKTWFSANGPISKPFQVSDPTAPHFVGVECSCSGSSLILSLQYRNFASKLGRFPHVVSIVVGGEALKKGDIVTVSLHNTTAPFLAGEGEVRVAIDPYGEHEHTLISRGAPYVVLPGNVHEIRAVAPSQAVVGEAIRLSVVALDRFFNPIPGAQGDIEVRGLGDEPLGARMKGGEAQILWTPSRVGFVWPIVTLIPSTRVTGERTRVIAQGNPIRIVSEPPVERLYWGDLQNHSTISKDAIGAHPFEFARDVMKLDFFASTEHSDDDRPRHVERNGILAREWSHVRRQVRDLYEPGRFVPILAYECTLERGHRCVYFRSLDGIPWTPPQLRHDIDNLWPLLTAGEAFAIPHHLGRYTRVRISRVKGPRLTDVVYGKRSIQGGPVVDWSRPFPPALQPALEIYSSHGSSELFDRDDALSYESVHYVPSRSARGAHYARDAWAAGHRPGVVGGSDNHSGQPGLPHTGLTAVLAPELTRDAVFDAVLGRRTYATTGERIYLEFRLAGARMGEVTSAQGPIEGEVLIAAPRAIAWAEVVKHELGSDEWTQVAEWTNADRLIESSFDDTASGAESVYYLRAELVGETGGRVARAWSTPVWLEQTAAGTP